MSATLSAYTCTPRQIYHYVVECIQAGLVPFVRSSAGMGKSSIMKAIAREFGLKVIDIRLSQSTPEDANGLPRFRDILDADGKFVRAISEFVPFDTLPIEGTEIPEGYNGWLIFFDEFNSGSRMVQAAMYKIILDRMVGQHNIHPNAVMVCAGNLDTDRAITNPISTAMQSRLVHLIMSLDHDEFMEDVVINQGWDPRIKAFLAYKRNYVHDFNPEHDDHTFCCPRTWDFMNRLIKGKEVTEDKAALYAGTITSGVAVEFITFTKVFDSLPRIEQIVRDPEHYALPIDAATRFATIVHLTDQVTDKTFEAITIYVNRMTAEMRVLFFRSLRIQQPDLLKHPLFRKALLELSRYLHDDDHANSHASRAA